MRLAVSVVVVSWVLVGCGGGAAAPMVTLPPVPAGQAGPSPVPSAPNDAAPSRAASTDDDARAEALLNATMNALVSTRDEAAAGRAAVPYLHRSLLDASGTDLSADTRTFSFKKAFAAASLYAAPVKITRVRAGRVTAIGFGPSGEKGRTVDYFVAKRDGVAGMPAPITVFFPDSGAPPKISNLGSL